MSLLSTKDFADYVGVKPDTLRKHISRKKVIRSGKLIDTENPVNKVYMQDHSQDAPVNFDLPMPKEDEVTQEIEKNPGKSGNNYFAELTMREKVAKTLKTEREAEYKRLQNMKMQGKLMPIELVEKTQTINIQGIFRSFESASENIASIYTERLGGNRADLADMITRMRQELERAIESAKQKSRDEIEALLEEYAETRSRGEKK